MEICAHFRASFNHRLDSSLNLPCGYCMERLPISAPRKLRKHFALRPQKQGCLLGTGTGGGGGGGEGGERVKARPRAPTRKTEEAVDRRQNKGSVKAVSPRHCTATSVLRSCFFNCCAGQSHKDNVRCTAVE